MPRSDEREDSPALDPRLLGKMLRIARIVDLLVIVVATLVLIGWAFNIEVLRSVVPGLTAMNPGGSALTFLLASASLWLLLTKDRTDRITHVAWSLAALVVAFASLRLILYTLGLEWGPDQWLFRAKLDLYQPPNRMAPNTALGLLMVGTALLTLDLETSRRYRPAQWLALAAALLSLLTIVGYICNAAMLIGIQAFVPMALNSAVTLELLSISLLLARPESGLMAVVSNRDTGGVMLRRLFPTAILAPIILAGLASAGQRAGLWTPSFGISLFVVATTVLFATLIWWNATTLNRIDVDRTRTQKQLASNGAILKSILNSLGDGVVVADREGRFLLFNPVAERILGLGATDAPPAEWTDQYGLFSPESGQPLKMDEIPLVKAIHGESTDQQELLIKNPQLTESVHISVTGRPLRGDDGIEGGVVVFQDTTQRRRAAEAIHRARDAAESANRAKSEFLANMSHEIRTPMNAVIGMTELVLDSDLNEMQRMYLKIVQDSAESLLMLINDILDFSKIEAGKLELDHAQFQLRDILGDAMKTLSVRTRGKELELACHVAPDVPDFLIGDPHRLRQVVTNLVGNALKFTEMGEVVLDVSCNLNNEEQVGIHVSVRDTGIGIPPDKLHLLFNAFSQVDASTTRRYGGTGLGLVITARLVELMDGRTWVESEPGKGSTFHFTARFEKDHSPPPPPVSPESLKDLRVLIVDDNSTNRLILNEMLTSWCMRPISLASAEEAMNELRRAVEANDPFRVVLSDVHMPNVDGFELASRIRQDERLHSTVIMMLTSGASSGDVTRCRELGAASHLIKPVKSSELLATIQAVVGSANPDRQRQDSISAKGQSLNILLAEDSTANQQLALGVLQKWGHHLTIAKNGQEAVDAFSNGTFDVILMDVQMPEMDGLQATARIRELEQQRGGHIPIVAMTAHAMKGDREEFMRAGMDEYVTKPIRWPEVRRALDSIAVCSSTPVTPAESATQCQDVEEPPVTSHGDDPPTAKAPSSGSDEKLDWTLDWNEALVAVDGNEGLLKDVMKELVHEWPTRLEELKTAISTGDAELLKRAAHTIRGSLRFFGETDAVVLAEQIESIARSGDVSTIATYLPEFDRLIHRMLVEIQQWLSSKS